MLLTYFLVFSIYICVKFQFMALIYNTYKMIRSVVHRQEMSGYIVSGE